MLLFIAADVPLGNVDQHLLTQQSLMELLIAEITDVRRICGKVGTSRDIADWWGVLQNDNDDVVQIQWKDFNLKGNIALEFLPPAVIHVWLWNNFLCGTVNLTQLPSTIESLYLNHNRFIGPIDLTQLPDSLQALSLNRNGFSGWTDFSKLPENLTWLNISETDLSGQLIGGLQKSFRAHDSDVTLIE